MTKNLIETVVCVFFNYFFSTGSAQIIKRPGCFVETVVRLTLEHTIYYQKVLRTASFKR